MPEPFLHVPYAESHLNAIYNLLFCDDVGLFQRHTAAGDGPLGVVLGASPDPAALRRIASDPDYEGRVRALAFRQLRAAGQEVPSGVLLGVVVEVPVDGGLDVLAAFREGSARYINHTGALAVFEGAPPPVTDAAHALVDAAEPLVRQIGPWEHPRLPAPTDGVRLTYVVSDGLYLSQGSYAAAMADPLAGPVLAAAERLLMAVVDARPHPEGD